jgi:hypothetical protein
MKLPPLRDAAFSIALAAGLLLTAAAGASFCLLLVSPGMTESLSSLPVHPWWLTYRQAGRLDAALPLWTLGSSTIVSLLVVISAIRARSHYLRSVSPIALFFSAYLFTFSLECLRGPSALLFVSDGPTALIMILSRAVYGGRFASELTLLAVGLFALEMKLRRYLVLLGIILLIVFAIAIYLPVDGTVFLSSLTCNLGDEQGTAFAVVVLGLLTPASLIGAAARAKRKEYSVLAGASVFLLAGREILSFSGRPALFCVGAVIFLSGIGIFLAVLGRLYKVAENA